MPPIPSAIVVVLVGGYFLFRRADIRLVLISSAAALFFVRATQPEVAGARFEAFAKLFYEFAKGMSNPNWVVPICSAMGFSYVCRLTGCDTQLVHLLLNPLKKVKWLLIPGGIAVAFFVNSAIVSQTSTVSVVGPVLIPILLAAGITRQTAGALLLLGGSMGGELLNPAAVEVTAIKGVTGVEASAIIQHLLPYNLAASGTALLVFWFLAMRYERRCAVQGIVEDDGPIVHEAGSMSAAMKAGDAVALERIDPFKAIVPLVPILLLMFVRRLITLPPSLVTSETNTMGEQATIGAAMLIGVVCAGATSPAKIGKIPAAFFEGAGFTYAHVISIITAASMFAESIRVNGLIDIMANGLKHAPTAVLAASIVLPWLMAAITGTAVGTAPLVIKIILPIAMGTMKPDAAASTGLRTGALNAIAAQFGRTSSPVAPVVIMCATLCRKRPVELVWRVAGPLVCGGVVLAIMAILRS